MSTLAEIEKAIAALPPEQWVEIRHWMDRLARPHTQPAPARMIPLVPATGRPITQQEIDEAMDAD